MSIYEETYDGPICSCLSRADGIGHLHGFHDLLCDYRCPATKEVTLKCGPFGWFRKKVAVRCEMELNHQTKACYPVGIVEKHTGNPTGRWADRMEWK